MNMQTFSTYCPVFTGFYNTVFDESDSYLAMELDNETDFREHYPEANDVPWEFITDRFSDYIDYAAANHAVAEYILDAIPHLYDNKLNLSVEFETLRSPREYNFANDAIDCKITLDIDALREYLYDEKTAFKQFLAARYTSRSGFISHYPSTLEEWEDDTENFTDLDGHYCGAILDFIAYNEHGEPEMTLYYAANGSEAFSNAADVDIAGLIEDYELTQED